MMNFPQFRILSGADVFYAIQSPTRFTEWKRMGSYYTCYDIDAKQYPEMLRIQDMLECRDGFLYMDENDFTNRCRQWESELKRAEF